MPRRSHVAACSHGTTRGRLSACRRHPLPRVGEPYKPRVGVLEGCLGRGRSSVARLRASYAIVAGRMVALDESPPDLSEEPEALPAGST